MAKSIMIQGAGSNVGKSMFVAGLARAFALRGMSVAPFKPQNMSNNAAVTVDGGEIGRAQALQAWAARRDPIVDMNPVLLKPETDVGSQVVVQGKRLTTVKAREYAKLKPTLMPKVLESFHRLAATADLLLVEGAGSPAEVNLRNGDIANMGFAQAADVPVVLVGDIDRGGVIAQLVGTHVILPKSDRDRIQGFAINKFRGDPTLFSDGAKEIADRTGWDDLGILPWFSGAWRLPAEDILDIATRPGGDIKIAVPRFSRIANFDDLDPLVAEPDVTVQIIEPGQPLPCDASLVLLAGSKSTIGDLQDMRAQGWDIDLMAHVRRGGDVLGICGGYQMLGNRIEDPDGIEGEPGGIDGLGLLDVTTVMTPHKRLTLTDATFNATGAPVSGYEIHIGETMGPDRERGWLTIGNRTEGASDATGRVRGCYLHGMFAEDAFRSDFLISLGAKPSGIQYEDTVDKTLNELATHMEANLDLEAILKMARPVRP